MSTIMTMTFSPAVIRNFPSVAIDCLSVYLPFFFNDHLLLYLELSLFVICLATYFSMWPNLHHKKIVHLFTLHSV